MTSRSLRGGILAPHSETFRSFADVLLTGFLVFVASLPLVTGFAALAAGVDVIAHAHEDASPVSIRRFIRTYRQTILRRWRSHVLLPTIGAALLAFDVLVLPHALGDSVVAVVVSAAVAVVMGVYALRFAAASRDAVTVREARERSARGMMTDAAGSALLAAAVLTAGAVTAIAPMLVFVIGGPLALAAVSVARRDRA